MSTDDDTNQGQRDHRDVVRGHMVRITDQKGGIQWVNAFLVKRVGFTPTHGATAVELLGSDRLILVDETAAQIAGRLMQAKIYTSDPASVVAGPLSMLAASLFSRHPGSAPTTESDTGPETKTAAQPSAKPGARRRGHHGA